MNVEVCPGASETDLRQVLVDRSRRVKSVEQLAHLVAITGFGEMQAPYCLNARCWVSTTTRAKVPPASGRAMNTWRKQP